MFMVRRVDVMRELEGSKHYTHTAMAHRVRWVLIAQYATSDRPWRLCEKCSPVGHLADGVQILGSTRSENTVEVSFLLGVPLKIDVSHVRVERGEAAVRQLLHDNLLEGDNPDLGDSRVNDTSFIAQTVREAEGSASLGVQGQVGVPVGVLDGCELRRNGAEITNLLVRTLVVVDDRSPVPLTDVQLEAVVVSDKCCGLLGRLRVSIWRTNNLSVQRRLLLRTGRLLRSRRRGTTRSRFSRDTEAGCRQRTECDDQAIRQRTLPHAADHACSYCER